MGKAYFYGHGVATNKQEAVRWWLKAAEQGDAVAQRQLGASYQHGVGVAKDPREAVRWFRKAAEQGDILAQTLLAAAYAFGDGVIMDDREAYIWLSIAKANGNELASEAFNKINWRARLTQSEIRSAQKEAARRLEEIDRRKEKHNEKFGL
ncbi:MAG: sel1 repeat family protein [Gammaproteobacteria bacterium]|nr:sel1 repeat family protein [Gammaproteobacteria bacterium]